MPLLGMPAKALPERALISTPAFPVSFPTFFISLFQFIHFPLVLVS